jgi:hypothetical protein
LYIKNESHGSDKILMIYHCKNLFYVFFGFFAKKVLSALHCIALHFLLSNATETRRTQIQKICLTSSTYKSWKKCIRFKFWFNHETASFLAPVTKESKGIIWRGNVAMKYNVRLSLSQVKRDLKRFFPLFQVPVNHRVLWEDIEGIWAPFKKCAFLQSRHLY